MTIHVTYSNSVVLFVIVLSEISKAVDMYMFLFDDILLLTRIKKPPRKVSRPISFGKAQSLPPFLI